MKKVVPMIVLAFMLVSCTATVKDTRHSPGGEEREKLLRERVEAMWDAMVNRDRGKVYDMTDPFFRARLEKNAFIGRKIPVYHFNPEVKSIDIKGNVAVVRVKVEYEIKEFMTSLGTVLNEPRKWTVTEERWIFIDNNWYRQFIDNLTDGSIAFY